MQCSIRCAASILMAAGMTSGAALASDDHGKSSGGAWWETDACCQHWHGVEDAASVRSDFDELTGRSLLNYPPHRFADHLHMRLELRIADMNTPRLEATQTLTLAPIGMDLPGFTLDCGPASSMQITGVRLGASGSEGGASRTVSYTQEGEELSISIEPAVPVGERFDVVIEYTLTDPPEGMTWTPESPAWPGRAAQLHTQGEPESTHYWFPCIDFPNERLTTEVIATVPSGFTVVSNGRLLEKRREGEGETFHWLQDKEHVNYLVTFVVGKFDVVEVGNGQLRMPVYAPVGLGGQVEQTYGRTRTMVRKFETILDEPYPWDKYAQVIVHNFAAGGMENTSATSMYDTSILDRTALLDGDLDGLIAHELAHQWFGDLMTCNSWEHIWLNEGFATFMSHVWFEERDGMDAYLTGMYQTFRGVAANDRADAPFRAGMASKEYAHPWDVFRRAANPYPKGASILHMLRAQLGDKLFLQGLREYVDRVKGKNVETDDLRYAFESVSGVSLDRFFRQWCSRPGIPVVDVDLQWDSAASALTVNLEQTQKIDGYNPAFFFSLPIWVETARGSGGEWITVKMDGREASQSFPLRAEPTVVAVNANLGLLADLRVHQPAERWLAQLERGPTAAAKMQAIDALTDLAKEDAAPPAAGEALLRVVRGDLHHAIRRAAASALWKVGGTDVYLKAMRQLPRDARVRAGLLESAADAYAEIAPRADKSSARFMDDLRQLAKRDESYGVRAAGVTQLGKIGGGEARSVIIEALDAPSQHDQIRRAALGALVEMDEAEGLELAIRYTSPGIPARTRPDATGAVGKLAHHNMDMAVGSLVVLLNDREQRTARAAGEALAELGGERARRAIDEYAAAARGEIAKAAAAGWVKKLAEKPETAARID